MADEHSVKAIGRNLSVSTKASVEICNFVRGKRVAAAERMLGLVIKKKQAVPYRRYNRDVCHKASTGCAGRYPVNASREFLNLFNTLKANAENKGLSGDSLIVTFAVANKGPKRWHYGRFRRRQMKSTHIELGARESEK